MKQPAHLDTRKVLIFAAACVVAQAACAPDDANTTTGEQQKLDPVTLQPCREGQNNCVGAGYYEDDGQGTAEGSEGTTAGGADGGAEGVEGTEGIEGGPDACASAPGVAAKPLSADCGSCSSGKVCVNHPAGGGLCINEPKEDATVAPGTPDLSCWQNTGPRDCGAIRRINVTACITVFGLDADTSITTLEITDQDNQPLDITATVGKVDGSVCNSRGQYTAANVPTNTQLRYRVRDASCTGQEEGCFSQFRETVQYNQYVPSAHFEGDTLEGDAAEIVEANVIADNTFRLIPIVAGFPGGVKEPNGGIAGTIRDCTDERMANATVETRIAPSNGRTVYFNGDSESPQPDVSRTSSNTDGTYAILDIPPGAHDVAALARISGKVTSAGAFHVALPPNSITILVFDGYRP